MANDNIKTVMGQTLTRLRKAHRLTQEQVADILKIKRSTYAYYERNITPTTENISKLAILFAVPTHELMYGEPDPMMGRNILKDSTNIFGNAPKNYGVLDTEERIMMSNFRLLPKNVKEKIAKEIEELKEKYEQ